MPTALDDLIEEAMSKINELRGEKEHLLEVIKFMAEADEDSDSLAVQAYAKEALKRFSRRT